MSTHANIMDGLARRHDVLLPILNGNPIHYLDLPFYGNVGDLLIMMGTLRFFKRHQVRVDTMGMYFNYSTSRAKEGDVIVFQGGGNFGDIYGPFQAFREKVIAALPNNRIVILPQSIHFSTPDSFDRCATLLSRHQDLHICVRDSQSAQMARGMTPNVYLLPDMAHQLWPMQRSSSPTAPLLQVCRRDREARNPTTISLDTFDWEDLVGKKWAFFLSQVAERCIFHAHRIGINSPFSNLEARLWIAQSERFVDQAVSLFSAYERIRSDRLHAHILSCLLSIPNQISDNSYGKNGRYAASWTAASPLVSIGRTGDEF